jgi:hypothetical protein
MSNFEELIYTSTKSYSIVYDKNRSPQDSSWMYFFLSIHRP